MIVFILSALLVLALIVIAFLLTGRQVPNVVGPPDDNMGVKPLDWYEQGPWKVTSNGEQICIQKGAEAPKPVYIVNEDLWGYKSKAGRASDHVTTTSYHSHRRVAYVDDIPLIKLRCKMLNEAAHKAAEAAGWAELGAQV